MNYLVGTVPFGVLLLKGRVAMFFVAFVVGGVPVIGTVFAIAVALRLAKPNSWWARRYYGHAKISKSAVRYPKAQPDVPAKASAVLGWIVLALFGPVAVIANVVVYG